MKYSKNKLISFISCFCLIVLTNTSIFGQEIYFEGIIEYSLEYDIKNPMYSEYKMKKYFGSKVITKFSNGNFRDEYYNNEGALVRISILNLGEKQYFMEFIAIDTIYYSDINITDYKTNIQQLSDTNILNNNCWVIKSTSIHKKNEKEIKPVITKYYRSKELQMNPDWYSEYIDGGYNRILKLAPGISIKSEVFNSNYTKIKSIVSKKAKVISNTEFEVKSNKFMKKMN